MTTEQVLPESQLEVKALRNWSEVREFNGAPCSKESTKDLVTKSDEDKRRKLPQSESLSLLLWQRRYPDKTLPKTTAVYLWFCSAIETFLKRQEMS